MSTARIGFYGHDAIIDLTGTPEEVELLMSSAKKLALGKNDVHLYYRIGIGEDTVALVSILEVQTITFLKDNVASDPGRQVLEADTLRDQSEAAFFLKGQEYPFRLDMEKGGPLGGMIEALLDIRYGEEGIGCVMLSDRYENPVFLRLDEIQFAVFDNAVLGH